MENIFLFLVFLAVSFQVSHCGNCTDGWLENGNYCYLFHGVTATLQGQNWQDSLLSCQRYGGNLLSVADNKENTFIAEQFKDPTIKNQHYWIGLNDIQKEGTYVWSDNSTSIFRFWNYRSGEPNNWNNNEDCAEASFDGSWNDNSCDRLFGFICKVKIGATTLAPPTLPPFPNNTDKPSTCEAGWIPWGTSCYGIINGLPKSWSDARADCLRRFGDLVIVDSKDEQSFIANQVSVSDATYWIGLTDSYREGEYSWVNGEKLNDTISYWRPNEPSNSFGNEDCVQMVSQDSGRWNDNHCSTLLNYICEKVSGVHNCPDGWIVYGDNCYQINAHPNQKVTYADAQKECHSFNQPWKDKIDVAKAELTSIVSRSEQTMLFEEFKKIGVSGQGKSFWIGLNSISSDKLHWSDLSDLNFTNYETSFVNDKVNKCVSSSLANSVGIWKVSSCDDLNNFVCKVKRGKDRCYDPLGMQGFQIPNSAITASGQLSSTTPPGAARLYLKNGNSLDGAWCEQNGTDLWLQVDFGQLEKLTFLAFQGKANSAAYVTSFYLKYSMDGVTWDIFGDNPPTLYYRFMAYDKRNDFEQVYNLQFPTPLFTRFIRIYPLYWKEAPCMRVEFYGCSQDEDSQACGLGWRKDAKSRSCYKIINQKTTWDSANSICFAEGGQLLSITSPDEMLYINTELKALSGKSDFFWIGMNDLDAKGIYKWSDQSPTFLVNWYYDNPKVGSLKTRCVLIRSADGFWVNEDCNSFNDFICKRKYDNPYEVKQPFNSNWRSSSDYYWPLDFVNTKNEVPGTVAAQYFGSSQPKPPPTFSVNLSNNQSRNVLSFNGKDNYLKAVGIKDCSVNPISNNCPHGFSASVLFKLKKPSSSAKRFIINSVETSSGYSIYIYFGKVYVYILGSNNNYLQGSIYTQDSWNHLVFTYSSQNGLNVFINGKLTASQKFAQINANILSSSSNALYFAKSEEKGDFSEVQLSSVAIFERDLSSSEIEQIYIAEFGSCGWGQEEVGTNCYSVNLSEMDWSSASNQCQMGNGSLVSINNPIEQAFVSLKAPEKMFPGGMWIGLNSKEKNHVYNWTDGSQLSFTFWNAMEPNNYGGRREDCVHTTVKGHWNDDLCYIRKPFICKYSRKIIHKVEKLDEYVVNFWNYQSLTFGCPLTKRVIIKSVYYGYDSCFLSQSDTVPVVQSKCSGPVCANVVASNNFFQKNICNSWYNKMNVTYSCEEDTNAVNSMGCPNGYTVYNDNRICYRLYAYKANLTEALKQCQSDSSTGNLASIHSREEELFLTTMLGALYTYSDVWLGMKYNTAEQVYSWMNNNTVNYTNWYNKQPDPRKGEYIKFRLYNGADDFLFWEAENPGEKLPFICRTLKVGTTEAPPPVTSEKVQTCDVGWLNYGDNCYFLNQTMLSFYDAEEACSKMGENGHLASVTSFELNNLLFNVSVYNNVAFTWFGLTNEGIINGYVWLDGSPLSFINWYTNSPYTGMRHLCAGMQNGGKWQDLQCYIKQAFFCQVPKRNLYQTTTTISPPRPTPTQDSTSCLQGWKLFNTNCYYFSNYSYLDWHRAKLACESANSSLTSISNLEENNFIASEIKRRYMQDPYIGLNDMQHESGWQWVDGSVSNFFNFDKNQPDDWYGMEDCVEFRSTGFWNDVACNLKKPYVCKKTNNTAPVQIVPSISPTAKPDSGYCDSNWTLYGNKCYFIKYGTGNRLQFKDAEELCRSMNATLTSVHSKFEQSFLLSQLYDAHETVYIGLSDRQSESTFIWNDQSSVDFTNWHIGQPDWFGEEDCVEIMPFFKEEGGWNDIQCEKENGYICSKKSLSSPPTTPITTLAPKLSCPEGYKLYQSSCYKYVASPMSWNEAWNECKKVDGGDLVSVHSPFEQGFLTSFFGERSAQFWIGLHKKIGEDQLHWTDNSPLEYNHWQTFQQSYVPKNEERCITHQYKSNLKGTWTNEKCSGVFPFVCKITYEETKGKPEFKGNCSAGWTKYNDLCYKLFSDYSERISWSEARERCSVYGGNLATITSEDVQKQLRVMVRNSYTSVWIGLNDQVGEHIFKWSNGEVLSKDSYTNWAEGEPNDVTGTENCVELLAKNGQWNDNQCSSQQNFLCEHTLECIDELGMVNRGIPDSNINATSYVNGSLPSFARLNYKNNNNQAAWCTNIKDGKQSITINLGEYMTITRINTQGLLNSGYVILYQLEYSSDGVNWNIYLDKDSADPRLIPANNDYNSIDGHKFMMEAILVRITPKKFYGNLICMRLEMFGCKSVCSKALGMQSNLIRNEDLSASSALSNFPVTNARPYYLDGWCAQTVDENQWYQIDLRTAYKVTRVMATGKGTLKYELAFSDDGKSWRNYKTLKGLDKLFSLDYKMYELDNQQVSRYVRFLPKEWNDKICLQVELFGCTIECDTSMGMETKIIPDKALTASSSQTGYLPQNARLNLGSYNFNGWCAQKIDIYQYLQISFDQEVRIAYISTQGSEGDTSKYVTKYRLQWSSDGDFWNSLPDELPGNSDGRSPNRFKLPNPILTKYIRINPTAHVNGICMRVELYGCPLDSQITPTEPPPKPKDTLVFANFRLTSIEYSNALSSSNTPEFAKLASTVEDAITRVYIGSETFKNGFKRVSVVGFRAGSVIVDFQLQFSTASVTDPIEPLKKQIATGELANFKVDKMSLEIKEATKGTRSGSEGGLSKGGKIGLGVFFVILIILIGLMVIYLRRKKGGFKHKVFENPNFDQQRYLKTMNDLSD